MKTKIKHNPLDNPNIIITAIVFVSLYPGGITLKFNYLTGDIAKKDIKAPRDLLVIDKEATKLKQKYAHDAILTVYDHTTGIAETSGKRVENAFSRLRTIIEEFESVSERTENRQSADSMQKLIWSKKKEFEKIIGITIENDIYAFFEKEKFSYKIPEYVNAVIKKIFNNGIAANKELLLKEAKTGIVLRSVETKAEKIINSEQKLKKFYGQKQAKEMVRIIGEPLLKDEQYSIVNSTVYIAQNLIQPNITLSANETEDRRRKAVSEVIPVAEKIKAGEMILREGERVTNTHLAKLEMLGSENDRILKILKGFGSTLLIVSLLLTIYFITLQYEKKNNVKYNKNLFLIASLFIFFFLLIKGSEYFANAIDFGPAFSYAKITLYFGIPVAAGAMLVCIFTGLNIAIIFSVVMSAAGAIILENRFEIFIYFLINSTMGAFWIRKCRERSVFIRAGLKISLLNILLVTLIDLHTTELAGFKLLRDWILGFSGGIMAGVLTSGIAPILEFIFGYTTDITLLELGNPEKPILKKLMMKAPGTYHHSVIVGSLAESAASEIGANPLLAKVCGYYHDIGKTKKPLYFIENQTNGKNQHDKLEPSMSSLILTAHVKEGVEIAKKHKLSENIIDCIRQHHGTNIISFFYEKAKLKKNKSDINIDDFRYPGPRPHTKEAALIMLADAVEAASRTLKNPTSSRIQGLVQGIINEIFLDGQLDNSDLTLKDCHSIAKSFNKVLNGIYHHRIEYPDKSTSENTNGKDKNGNNHKKQANQTKNNNGNNTSKNAGRLKRLGLS